MDPLEHRIQTVRRFNRFFTRQIGLLGEGFLDSQFSLTEGRILYELANRAPLTATELGRELGLNGGYLSRVIAGFGRKGLLRKTPSATDARASQLVLTEKGEATFASLDDASQAEIMSLLASLSEPEQAQLVEAMEQIQSLLSDTSSSYILRDPEPGDMGWVVHRQAVLYTQEYGWNSDYEALVAEIVAKFVRNFDRRAERCWIAEKDGKVVGSVFIVREDDVTARLRLLYVEPSARGLGIGQRLVEECLRFSKLAGYTRIVLWTNSILASARTIYDRTGFTLVAEQPHHSFGKELLGQTFTRDL